MSISSLKSKKALAITVLGLVLIVGAKLLHTGPFHKETPVVAGSSFTTKGVNPGSAQSTANSTQDNSAPAPKTTSSLSLFTPSGDFVSNHHPNLSGSPAPNTMSSVCNTTPGATCKITFTRSGITKELAAKTADANGSAFWNWKLQDIGLTSGTWQIQAVASLNGQTKTAFDAMDLVVAQ